MNLREAYAAMAAADDAGDSVKARQWAQLVQDIQARVAGGQAPKPPPQSGFFAAGKGAIQDIQGDFAAVKGKTGLMDPDAAEKEIAARKQAGEAVFRPDEAGWSKPFNKFGELLGGSLPYMAAPIAAGAGAAMFGAPAAVGLGAAGLLSAAQFTGSNLTRAMDEGATLKEASLPYAAMAAVPQAALDMIGFRFIPGIRRIFTEAGKDIAPKVAQKVFTDYAKATATSAGVEGITESGQQLLERLQAGLSITNEKARAEYFESFVGGAVLGGALAPAGRYVERGREADARQVKQDEAAAVVAREKMAAAAAAKAQKEADMQKPEYLTDVAQRYAAFRQQVKELQTQINLPVTANDIEGKQAQKEAKFALKALTSSPETRALKAEYALARPRILAMGATPAEPAAPEEKATEEVAPVAPVIPTADMVEAKRTELTQRVADLYARKETERRATVTATDLDEIERLGGIFKQTEAEHAAAEAELAGLPAAPKAPKIPNYVAQITRLEKLFADAVEAGDVDALLKTAAKLKTLNAIPAVAAIRAERAEVARRAKEEAAAGREIDAMGAKRMDTSRTEQQSLIPNEDPAMPPGGRAEDAELLRRLADARKANDIDEVDRLVEKLRMSWSGALPRTTPSETQGTEITRPRAATAQSLREQIARLPENLTPEQDALVDRLYQNVDALAATPKRGEMAAEWLHRLALGKQQVGHERVGQAKDVTDALRNFARREDVLQKAAYRSENDLLTRDLKAELDFLERGKVSETEGRPKIARQLSLERILRETTDDKTLAGRADAKAMREERDALEKERLAVPILGKSKRQRYLEQQEKELVAQGAVIGRGDAKSVLLRKVHAEILALDTMRLDRSKVGGPSARQLDIEAALISRHGGITPTEKTSKFGMSEQERLLRAELYKLNKAREPSPSTEKSQRQLQLERKLRAVDKARGPADRGDANEMQGLLAEARNPETTDKRRTAIRKELKALKSLTGAEKDAKAADTAQRQQDEVDTLEQERLAQPETGRTALQGELPFSRQDERRDKAFSTPEDFQEFLGSESLHRLRQQMGETAQTIARAVRMLMPINKRIAQLQDNMAAEQDKFERSQGAWSGKKEEAAAAHEAALERFGLVKLRIELSLPPVEMLYLEAKLALETAVDTQTRRNGATVIAELHNALMDARDRLDAVARNPLTAERATAEADVRQTGAAVTATGQAEEKVRKEGSANIEDARRKIQEYEFPGRAGARAAVAAAERDVDAAERKRVQTEQELEMEAQALDVRPQAMRPIGEKALAVRDVGKKAVTTELLAAKERLRAAKAHLEEIMKFGAGPVRDIMAPVEAARDARLPKPAAQETRAERDARGDAATIADQQALERENEAFPARKGDDPLNPRMVVSFEKQREMRDKLDDAEAIVGRYQAALDAGPLPEAHASIVTQRNRAIAAVATLRDLMSREGGTYAEGSEEMTPSPSSVAIAGATKRVEKLQAAVDAKRMAAAEKGLKASTRKSRVDSVNTAEKALAEAQNKLLAKRGIEITPKLTAAESGDAFELDAKGKRAAARLEADLAEAAEVIAGTSTNEVRPDIMQMALLIERGDLPARRIGPTIRKYAVVAGDQRTGSSESMGVTKGEPRELKAGMAGSEIDRRTQLNKTGTRNPAMQSGRLKPVSVVGKKAAAIANKIAAGPEGLKAEARADKEIEDAREAQEAADEAIDVAFDKRKINAIDKRLAGLYDKRKQAKEEKNPERVKTLTAQIAKAEEQRAGYMDPDPDTEVDDTADYLRGTSGENDTALHDVTIDTLHKNDLSSAVADIGAMSKDPVARRIANRIKGMLGSVEVQMVEDMPGEKPNAPGGITKDGKKVFINTRTGMSEESVLHEVGHAVTLAELNKPDNQLTPDQRAAKAELKDMHNQIKQADTLNNDTVKDPDLNEFVAESLGSKQVQAHMRKTMWKNKQTFWQKFKSLVMRMLRMPLPKDGPMLDRFLDLADKFMVAPEGVKGSRDNAVAHLRQATTQASTSDIDSAIAIANRAVAKTKTVSEKVKAAVGGWLPLETMFVDRFAPLQRLSRMVPGHEGSQMMFYARFFDQKMHHVAQSVSRGALQLISKTRKDGGTEHIIESIKGPSILSTVNILKTAPLKDKNASNRLFTIYMAAIRADRVGLDVLDFGGQLTQADIDSVRNAVNADPVLKDVFERARDEYNEYNKGQIDFAVQSGAISKDLAKELLANNDFIPYYRERGGVVELMIGGENPFRIGSITEQPYLKELVGGGKPILDFITSSIQNTNMLTDMSLRNLATKSAVFSIQAIDKNAVRISKKEMAGTDVVQFKVDGEDRYAQFNTDLLGIPADLLVKGMHGIPTQMPGIVKTMALSARLLRNMVVLNPLYAARQVVRDSLGSFLMSGSNASPIISALKQINSTTGEMLDARGVTGGQVFTGDQEDMVMILRSAIADKTAWGATIAKLQSMSMTADALTRRAQYDSYIEQGLSEMEATLQTLEAMNFSKRGASPSIHWVNSMIPFFNAQVQGLNVLYKSMRGQMPFNERLKIQEKLRFRGALLFGASLVYAAAMEDDEAYQNADPAVRLGNWFVRIPGLDEPIKIPVPFELGYIFKALPEELYRLMTTENKEGAGDAFRKILMQSIPGGSSYFLPQAVKPAVEALTGHSLYTGRGILSAHEQGLLAEDQFRANTTELAKAAGAMGVSPVMLEHVMRGYTAGIGIALMQAVSTVMPATGSTKPAGRLSEVPVLGVAFQSNDAGGIINSVYDMMKDAQATQKSYKERISRGDFDGAQKLIDEKSMDFVLAKIGGKFTQAMGDFTKYENVIRADTDMTPQAKREALDSLRQDRITVAKMIRQAARELRTEAVQ